MSEGRTEVPTKPQQLIHLSLPVGMLQCNCSILGDPVTREAIVLDPGDEVTRIMELIGRHQLQVKAIVSTHAHIDHVGGLKKLYEYTGAPVLMHREDVPLYQAMDEQAAFLGVRAPELTEVHQFLRDGDMVSWGSLHAQVLHTPGHTPGSSCLFLPPESGKVIIPAPRLFAGDTLFAGSIGRTDLWGGSMNEMMESLKGKIMQLPEDTVVYPGHGANTTIGEERQSNPFLVRK